MRELKTNQPEVELVELNIERDAPVSFKWLEGKAGRKLLELMGNPKEDIRPTTLEEERKRIKGYIESEDQLFWSITLEKQTVGMIWVDLKLGNKDNLRVPALSLMIGDPLLRRRGVGKSALEAVIGYMHDTGQYRELYARHLVDNVPVSKLLEKVGFSKQGEFYPDENQLNWQNVELKLM